MATEVERTIKEQLTPLRNLREETERRIQKKEEELKAERDVLRTIKRVLNAAQYKPSPGPQGKGKANERITLADEELERFRDTLPKMRGQQIDNKPGFSKTALLTEMLGLSTPPSHKWQVKAEKALDILRDEGLVRMTGRIRGGGKGYRVID